MHYRARSTYTRLRSDAENSKFSMSYVTGSHAFKVGVQEMHGWRTIYGEVICDDFLGRRSYFQAGSNSRLPSEL
jgi:hypothetical protein